MTPKLYKAHETDFAGAGFGALSDCISCTVSQEINGEFVCTFTYPRTGALFSEIKMGRIVYAPAEQTEYSGTGMEPCEPFTIYGLETGDGEYYTFYAHHVSYLLGRSVCKKYTSGTSLSGVLQWLLLNRTTSSYFSQLKYNVIANMFGGYIHGDISSAVYNVPFPMTARDALIGSNQYSLVNRYPGCEFAWRGYEVHLYSSGRGQHRNVILTAENFSSFRHEYDKSGVSHFAVPFWTDGETVVGLTGSTEMYSTYPPAIDGSGEFGSGGDFGGEWEGIPVELSSEFSTQPTEEQLYYAATSWYNQNALGTAYENLTVTFSANDVPTYSHNVYFDEAPVLQLGDTCTVYIPALGITRTMRVVKTTYDALAGRYTQLEFGTPQRTIFNVNSANNTRPEFDNDAPIDDMIYEVDDDTIDEGIPVEEE